MCCQFSEYGDKLAVGLSNGDIKVSYYALDNDKKFTGSDVLFLNF